MIDDQKYWCLVQSFDREAFARLYQYYYPILVRYGIKLSLDQELTKDSVQELFCHVWEKGDQLPVVANVSAYLKGSLRNMLYKKIKLQSSFEEIKTLLVTELIFSFEEQLMSDEELKHKKAKLASAFNNLTKRQQEVIRLRYFEGLDYSEITDYTSLKNKTIRNIIHEALKSLKRVAMVIAVCLLS